MTLTVTIAKPYCKAYMNYCDIAMLSHLATFFCVLSSGRHALLLARILLNIPILIFVLVIISKKGYDICKVHLMVLMCKCCIYLKGCRSMADAEASNRKLIVDSPTEAEPLIQPTSIICSYGTKSNEVIVT